MTFNPMRSLNSTNPISIPCGRCTGCKLERSRQWAVRCMHEASLHQENCFITLTYSNDHLPVDYSVHPRDLQLFFKRLRKQLFPTKIRFFACGEYGETNLRPHYHALIFGHSPQDKTLYETTPRGDRLYLSKSLQKSWPFGLVMVGALTFESAAYTARYAMKKQTGPQAETYYLRQHPLHGFICRVRPEFLNMSRRPGIGAEWINKYRPEVFPSDSVLVRERLVKPPRYYLNQLTEEEKQAISRQRRKDGLINKGERNNRRRAAKAEVRDARISTLQRKL